MSGIWKYFDNQIEEKNRLTLEEGSTRLDFVAEIGVYLKREDENPTGSQKDRSLCYQLSALVQKGITHFCISSSGNAAISAAAYFNKIQSKDKKLDIFVGEKLPSYKKERLDKSVANSPFIEIHVSKQAKKECIQFANKNKAFNLRGSMDPLALIGFKTIGFEIQDSLPDADAIFIPTSSGTTLMGIYSSYIEKGLTPPAIHAVQTAKVPPISQYFDKDFESEKASKSSAITDIIAFRKKECIEAIKNSNGFGWVIENADLIKAKEAFLSLGFNISYDSSLALAAFKKATKNGFNYKKPILLITGI